MYLQGQTCCCTVTMADSMVTTISISWYGNCNLRMSFAIHGILYHGCYDIQSRVTVISNITVTMVSCGVNGEIRQW